MITTDGHDTKNYRQSVKFGGWHNPVPTGMRGRWAEMTGHLYDLDLDGHADETDSNPDQGEGWARFGRRVLRWESSGAIWHDTFTNEIQAMAWCVANTYEVDDD